MSSSPEPENSADCSSKPFVPADGLTAVIEQRRMVRALSSEPLPPGLIDSLLDTARRAPSAGNSQAIGFLVLDRPQTTKRYWDITLPEPRRSRFRWQQLLDAPVLILVTTEPARYTARYAEPDKVGAGRTTVDDWPVPYWWVDAGAAIQNLLLLVTEARLGACLFGPFDHEPQIAEEFEVPTEKRIVATIAVGHRLPDEPGRSFRRARRPMSDVVIRPY